MSQENVELVYRGFDAWTRHDLDEALAGSDPDVEITPVMGPASTTSRGHEGMRTWANHLFSTFPEYRGSGSSRPWRFCGRHCPHSGPGSGQRRSSEQTVWYASQWRDGKLLWYRAFESESEAVKAVGLRD